MIRVLRLIEFIEKNEALLMLNPCRPGDFISDYLKREDKHGCGDRYRL
jgi:hypothetical protein